MIINIGPSLFQKLAKEYGPYPNFNETMKNEYGLVRHLERLGPPGLQFEVIDEQKYLFFKLKWL